MSPQVELKIFLNNFPRQEWARARALGLSTGTGNEKQRTSRKFNKNVKMTSPWIKHGQYPSSPLPSSLAIVLFPLTRNFWALTICMENLVFKWKGSTRWNVFGKKLIPSLPSPNSRTFLYHLFRTIQAISKKTAMPRIADSRDESLPFQTVCYLTAVYSLRHW